LTLKILHIEADTYSSEAKNIIENIGKVDYCHCNNQEEFHELVSKVNYNIIFIKLGISLNEKTLDLCKSLQYVVTPTTGQNHLDVEAILKKGIHVISLKGETDFLSQVYSTAEHTWALLLSVIRFIPNAYNDVLNGNWQRHVWMGRELADNTLGIIGYGRLGRMVARYGLSFNMKVIVYDINNKISIEDERIQRVDTIKELLAKSFVVSLHIPLNKGTNRFFSKELFYQMPHGSVFVNTSRGELVDEKALLQCLEDKHLSAAALDVLNGDTCWSEKIPSESLLLKYAKEHNNLIITPHIGGYARESISKTRKFVSEKLLRLIRELKNCEKQQT